ncbi:class I SAM-dependent methyltransferase [Micromonospora sp. NBC_01699]|uniref:class I SAM-dependent methyltransferase n=1 Tax=Micromonospora sp. NBC_01699 TaxID=2975984 RepID=UPI002E2CC095|nr:class I SAM-dependent methyltransferase [Micromonospora sp. NBC_01699]
MTTERTSYGAGPGPITPDGCAVNVYAQLPPNGEPEVIHRAVPPGTRILELGCGTGRLSNPLAELGHRVVGVDESATMLAHRRSTGGTVAPTGVVRRPSGRGHLSAPSSGAWMF